MENRNGLVVSAVVTYADGFGERNAALAMLDALPQAGRRTVAADKAYDTRDFVDACRARRVTPHIACNDTRRGVARSTAAPRATLVIGSVRSCANASRSISAGARPWAAFGKRCFVDCAVSITSSSSP